MSNVNTAENLRFWLKSCPEISNMDRFGVDYMGKDPIEYAIYTSPSPITYYKDILGITHRNETQELNYSFVILLPFSRDVVQNTANLGLLSGIINWINERNQENDLPEIAEGTVLSVTPSLSPYVFDANSDSGRYQIQIKIKYRPRR